MRGFQRAEKPDGKARIYQNLTGQAVEVVAFPGIPAEGSPVRWMRLPEDHDTFANQWFLVTGRPNRSRCLSYTRTSPPG